MFHALARILQSVENNVTPGPELVEEVSYSGLALVP